MEFRVFTEPQQGASYDDLLAVARKTEECGYDAFFRSDHFLAIGGSGLPGPTDAWVTLAGLARDTQRIRLGTLLTSATFRLPGPLAISVAEVDAMSDGRVELGLGAGWYDAEHRAYGIPFPSTRERFDRLEEQLAIITGLWATSAGAQFSFDGDYYSLSNSPALPKPVQPRIPIIVGGQGPKRTPALAARFATEFNYPFPRSVQVAGAQFGRVRDACSAVNRDPDDIVLSVALTLCCGRDDREVERRAAAIGSTADDLRRHGLAGTPDEILERLHALADVGTRRIYLQTMDLSDLDHLELVATDVVQRFH